MAELLGSTDTADEKSRGSLTADTDLSALLTAILGDAADVTDIRSNLEVTLRGIVSEPRDAGDEQTTRFEPVHIDLSVVPPAPLGTTDLLVGPLKDDVAAMPVAPIPQADVATVDLEVGRQLDERLGNLHTGALADSGVAVAPMQAGNNERSMTAETVTPLKKQGSRQSKNHKRTKGAWVVTAPAAASVTVESPAAANQRGAGTIASTRRDSPNENRADRKENRFDSRHQQPPGEPDLRAVDGRLVSSAQATTASPYLTQRDDLFAGHRADQESATRWPRERLPMLLVAGIVVVGLLVWLAMRQAA